MAPSTFAGFVFFAASLGPGFVFLRVAERRHPRAQRSSLAEAVEMVVLGAALSLVSAVAVLAAAKGLNKLDWAALVEHPNQYIAHHPFRLIVPLGAVLLLSYGAAWGLASLLYAGLPKVVHPGLTMWQQALWHERPQGHTTLATVELHDGRKVVGQVRGFTVQESEHREIMLAAPLAVVPQPGAEPEEVSDAFMVFREDQLAYISGRYWPPAAPADSMPESPAQEAPAEGGAG